MHHPTPHHLDPDTQLRESIARAEEDVRLFGPRLDGRRLLSERQGYLLHDVTTRATTELERQVQLKAAGKFQHTALDAELPIVDAEVAMAAITFGHICRAANEGGRASAMSVIGEELGEAVEDARAGRRGPLLVEVIQTLACIMGLAARLRGEELDASAPGGAR